MDYIPKRENRVAKGRNRDGIPYWDPLTVDDLKKCLDPGTPSGQLKSLFPGPCFFGPLAGPAGPEEMLSALSILKMTRELHEELKGYDSLFGMPDAEASTLAERAEGLVRRCGAATIVRGGRVYRAAEGRACDTPMPHTHLLGRHDARIREVAGAPGRVVPALGDRVPGRYDVLPAYVQRDAA